MNVNEMAERARRWRLLAETAEGRRERDLEVLKLAQDDRWPALWSVLLEVEEDLTHSVATYDRDPQERTMDAGGLASIRKLRGDLEGAMRPAVEEKEAAPPKKVGE